MSDKNEIFILQNQDKLFFGKQKEWLDGRDANALFKTPHKDEAINQLVEVSSKDYTQRIKVLGCAVSEKGLPMIDAELLPPPQPKPPKKADDEGAVAAIVAEQAQMTEHCAAETSLATDETDTADDSAGDESNPAQSGQSSLL